MDHKLIKTKEPKKSGMLNSEVDSSWKSIFSVTLPIVLSSLSNAVMYNIDRVMIAAYSTDALNAVCISGNLFGVFSFLFIGITDTAEVYVGQYNGSRNYDRLASPVWQMLYFSFATSIIFFPIAYFSETLNLLPRYYFNDGVIYQKIMMYGGLLFPMFTGLAAFFVGQGRAKIVTISIICGSILNVFLDYILIYGINKAIPSLGSAGAALATVMSQAAQNLMLIIALCSKRNRSIVLRSCKFDKKTFFGCIRIGTPLSVSNFLVLLAWYIVQSIIANSSKEEATIYSICLSIYLLIISLGEGLSKATSAVAANMIGRKDMQEIKIAYRKFLFLALIISVFFAFLLSFFPEQCLFSLLEKLPENISAIFDSLKIALRWISANVILESLLCVVWGILIAGGDTMYPTVAYQSCIWGFVVIPIAVCRYCGYFASTLLVYKLSCLWLCGSLALFYKRYLSMKWYNKLI